MRPDALTNQIVLYCLAWAASKFGMLVHAVVFMSNHYHLVLTDTEGRLPEFLRDFNRSVAKALNVAQGQCENLWSVEHASAVLLPSIEDVLGEVAYSVANPVAAGLVENPAQWPGVLYWVPGSKVTVQRPSIYFDPNGSAPESVELRIVAPPGVDEKTWLARVVAAVVEAVSRARQSVVSRGLSFLGAAAVMAQSFLARPKGSESRGAPNPVLTARRASVRTMFRSILLQFRRAYAAALASWKAGDRRVEFPFGTWWMRVHHGVTVAPPPTW